MIIETPRLRLVPHDRVTLARECGAEVPASWPPELWDQDARVRVFSGDRIRISPRRSGPWSGMAFST